MSVHTNPSPIPAPGESPPHPLATNARQLCLFKFPRPLLERLGKAFFANIPAAPGVYMMADPSHRVLYIGQSQNLRLRLAYYKNAQPEREPRRIIRLVYQTETIRWERCETPREAQIRELELIREHRPRFNRAHNRPPSATFLHLLPAPGQLQLRISPSPLAQQGELSFGPFRYRTLCRHAFLAIGRLFWLLENNVTSAYDFPLWLHERAQTTSLAFKTEIHPLLQLLTGQSPSLIDSLPEPSDPCLRTIVENDKLTLAEFYSRVLNSLNAGPPPPPADELIQDGKNCAIL